MAMFKKVLDLFVTIEEDESAKGKKKAPKQAASKDAQVAAQAAREFVESDDAGAPATTRGGTVGEMTLPQSGRTINEELSASDLALLAEMEAELSGPGPQSAAPARPASTPGVKRRSLDDFEDDFGDDDFGDDFSAEPGAGGYGGGYGASDSLEVKSFDNIYGEMGLPLEGSDAFTVYTVRELLNSPHLKDLPTSTKRASLLVAMQARDVHVEQVIEDAFERDQAIDHHDLELAHQLQSAQAALEEKNAELQAEMERLLEEMRTKIAENNATLEAARESYRAWRELKKEEEKRLFEAVSLFVERADNPVSVDN